MQPRKSDHSIFKRRIADKYFVDRDQIIDEIKDNLECDPRLNIPRSVALQGMSGVGKTQIALDYSRNASEKKRYHTCLWINASSTATLITSFNGIARTLSPNPHWAAHGLKTKSSRGTKDSSPLSDDPMETVRIVIAALNQWTEQYLLVYDNFDDNKIQIRDYLPTTGPVALLFTSRRQDLQHTDFIDRAISVPVLSPEQSLDLLTKRLGPKQDKKVACEKTQAKLFVERLGYLPLTIAQTAAYIATDLSPLPFSFYLRRFEDERDALLKKVPSFSEYTKTVRQDGKEFESCVNVFTTCEISLGYLISSYGEGEEEEAHKGVHFLTLCSYFDCRRISQVMFEKHLDRNAQCQYCRNLRNWSSLFRNSRGHFSSTFFRDLIHRFANLSLVDNFEQEISGSRVFLSLSLHPLIRDWATFRHPLRQQQIYCAEAFQILNDTVIAASMVRLGFSEITIGKLFCESLGQWNPIVMFRLIEKTAVEFRLHLLHLLACWRRLSSIASEDGIREVLRSLKGLALLAENDECLAKDPNIPVSLDLDFPDLWHLQGEARQESRQSLQSWKPSFDNVWQIAATAMARQVYRGVWGIHLQAGLRVILEGGESDNDTAKAVNQRLFTEVDCKNGAIPYLLWLCKQIPFMAWDTSDQITIHQDALTFLQSLEAKHSPLITDLGLQCILLLQIIAKQCIGLDAHTSSKAISMVETLLQRQDDRLFIEIHQMINDHLRALLCYEANQLSKATQIFRKSDRFLYGVYGENGIDTVGFLLLKCHCKSGRRNRQKITRLSSRLLKATPTNILPLVEILVDAQLLQEAHWITLEDIGKRQDRDGAAVRLVAQNLALIRIAQSSEFQNSDDAKLKEAITQDHMRAMQSASLVSKIPAPPHQWVQLVAETVVFLQDRSRIHEAFTLLGTLDTIPFDMNNLGPPAVTELMMLLLCLDIDDAAKVKYNGLIDRLTLFLSHEKMIKSALSSRIPVTVIFKVLEVCHSRNRILDYEAAVDGLTPKLNFQNHDDCKLYIVAQLLLVSTKSLDKTPENFAEAKTRLESLIKFNLMFIQEIGARLLETIVYKLIDLLGAHKSIAFGHPDSLLPLTLAWSNEDALTFGLDEAKIGCLFPMPLSSGQKYDCLIFNALEMQFESSPGATSDNLIAEVLLHHAWHCESTIYRSLLFSHLLRVFKKKTTDTPPLRDFVGKNLRDLSELILAHHNVENTDGMFMLFRHYLEGSSWFTDQLQSGLMIDQICAKMLRNDWSGAVSVGEHLCKFWSMRSENESCLPLLHVMSSRAKLIENFEGHRIRVLVSNDLPTFIYRLTTLLIDLTTEKDHNRVLYAALALEKQLSKPVTSEVGGLIQQSPIVRAALGDLAFFNEHFAKACQYYGQSLPMLEDLEKQQSPGNGNSRLEGIARDTAKDAQTGGPNIDECRKRFKAAQESLLASRTEDQCAPEDAETTEQSLMAVSSRRQGGKPHCGDMCGTLVFVPLDASLCEKLGESVMDSKIISRAQSDNPSITDDLRPEEWRIVRD